MQLQMIHEGEYNILKVWDYAALATALSNGDGTTYTTKVQLGPASTKPLCSGRI